MVNAIVIDDEEISLKALGEKINAHCPGIRVIKLFHQPEQALKEMEFLRPELVFLDIEMPKMNGFSFLKHCSPVNFDVIFTTAYSDYAIQALRLSAFDFILKPIDIADLIRASTRLQEKIKNQQQHQLLVEQQMQVYQQYQSATAPIGKIALPVINGLEFIDANTILKVQGENVYSHFYLENGKKIVASITLKEADAMLNRFGFFRVHKSYIVNLKHITRYIKGEGGTVILADGSEVEVSRRNKGDFLKRIAL